MNRLVASLLLLCASAFLDVVDAQTRATTQDGRPVLLYPDGTWKFVEPKPGDVLRERPPIAKQLYETRRGGYGIWYDDAKWKKNSAPHPAAEASFVHADGDAWVMVIAERLQVPRPTLKQVALANARAAAPDARLVLEEPRRVNALDVLCLQIEGTIQGVAFVYLGYYYSSESGTIQLLGYTGKNLFAEYEKDIAGFLDGLTLKPADLRPGR